MSVEIPNRAVFRAPEVCELAGLQPYVLRTWEAEFPDLGVAKTAGGPRMYRRADVERVLLIKHLLFEEGLTLSGARRRLNESTPNPDAPPASSMDADVAALIDQETRKHLYSVRQGLQWILGVVTGHAAGNPAFSLTPSSAGAPASSRPGKSARKSTPAASAKGAVRSSGKKSPKKK